MLHESGFPKNNNLLRKELFDDVKIRHLSLVKLLVKAEISLDVEPYNAVNYAVSKMDLKVLSLMKDGRFTLSVNSVLDSAPPSASETDMLQLISMLAPRGLAGKPLDLLLVQAVVKKQAKLTTKLVQCGASIEYKDARAVKLALTMVDYEMLTTLLEAPCSPSVLSGVIPETIAIGSRGQRLKAFEALIDKGVYRKSLGLPLQTLVAEAGQIDIDLIKLLLKNKAPVDGVGDEASGAIFEATRRGNLALLRMLCDGRPATNTLSQAVPDALGVLEVHGYDVSHSLMRLLLEKGANGLPVHQTLLIAARQDLRHDIVRLLVQYGGEANYAAGSAFGVALEAGDLKLLQILCAGCPPNQASLEALLYTATDARFYSLEALSWLLASCPASSAVLNASWSSDKFRGNPNMTAIIPCLLRHGLDVNLHDGEVVCFAVQEKNTVLLARILSSNPSLSSLTAGFQAAASENTPVTLELMSLLLEKADSAEIGQSKALQSQVLVALTGSLTSLCLLLQHNASVDFDGGKVIRIVAEVGSLDLLDILLEFDPCPATIIETCLAVAASDPKSQSKQLVLERLLAASGGMASKDMTRLLHTSVTQLPKKTLLPKVLLSRNIVIKFETLEIAVTTCSKPLVMLLLDNERSPSMIAAVFKKAIKTKMSSNQRYWVYECFLGREGIPSSDVSAALLESMKGSLKDLSLQKLLLQHDASVSYEKGEAFSLALRAKSLDAVRLLSQYVHDDATAGLAFDHARKASLIASVQLQVYRCFSQWNLRHSSLNKALLQNLKSSPDKATVQFLLERGADPNNDAQCFSLATRAGEEAVFRSLSRYASLHIVIRTLMSQFDEEWEVARWFRVCLEEQPHSATIDDDGLLLFRCMAKFPRSGELVKLLVDNGVSAATKKPLSLCPPWPPEECTPVLWALFAKPRVENDAIIALLSRCDAELPTYKTPETSISAAFACLLDKTRIPVLQTLLELDRDHILSYTVPGPVFSHIAAYPSPPTTVIDNHLTLMIAALYLGNLDAFRLLGGGETETPDDGTLHLAAWLALPDFVDHLLDRHHQDFAASEFDGYIPLAMACKANDNSWSRFAKTQGDWRTRQKKTIDLLAPTTKFTWRSNHLSLLHVALLQGVQVTEMMIQALDLHNDPERDEGYLYVDREGLYYSPHQWLRKVSRHVSEADRLLALLDGAGMQSRYFKKVAPGAGTQPLGYHGLPPGYAILWNMNMTEDGTSRASSLSVL